MYLPVINGILAGLKMLLGTLSRGLGQVARLSRLDRWISQSAVRFADRGLKLDEPIELSHAATIVDVDQKSLDSVVKKSDVPVLVVFHARPEDDAIVRDAESAARIAGRVTLAKADVTSEKSSVSTPRFIISHEGVIGTDFC